MPKGKKKRKIPKHGRPMHEINSELGLNEGNFSPNVQIGNTDPTVVQGVMYGGMPEGTGASRGPLRQLRGKKT